MEKLSPTLILVFLIGGLIGYVLHSALSPIPQAQTQKEVQASDKPASLAHAGSPDAKIASALSAAPQSVAQNATVIDYPASGSAEMAVLRKGTNDWSCLPDFPGSPGKDPMCVDKQGMLWLQAYATQKDPNLTQAGLGYMLAGGSDASNTDPFATGPTQGNDWISTPAHLMVFPAGKLDPNIYGTDPKRGGSWIMWAGTPYEHLMVPVK